MSPETPEDARSSAFLDAYGRRAYELGLRLAWTDGLQGAAAKACTRGGSAKWTNAQPLPGDREAAAASFRTRCRSRNPAVPACANNLVLAEADGDLDQLLRVHRLPALPRTLTVRSRRGRHLYYRPPPGRPACKVQFAPDAVTVSTDGYLVGAGALHESGHVYVYEDELAAIEELPLTSYDRISAAGEQAREQLWADIGAGEEIPVGQRNDSLFHEALLAVRAGKQREETLALLHELNARCAEPLEEKFVVKALNGAIRWARTHPTEQDRLRAVARRVLDEKAGRVPVEPRRRPESPSIVPLADYLAGMSEEAEWIVDHLIASQTLTLFAGLPKVGKSTFVYAALAAITRAADFLGLPARAASILLLTEEAPSTVEEKVDRFGITVERVWVLPKRRIRSGIGWKRIVQDAVSFCEKHPEVQVVVIDTIDKFADINAARSESDSGVGREMLDPLYDLLRLGAAVVLITHQRKEPGEHGLRVRGGTFLTGSVDVIAEVERAPAAAQLGADARVVKLSSRFEGTPDEIAVLLEEDGWRSVGVTVAAAKRRARHEQVQAALDTTPATLEEIHERLEGISPRTLRRRLDGLVEAGLVQRSGEGVRGDPWRWWVLQSPADQPDAELAPVDTSPREPAIHADLFAPTAASPRRRNSWHESENGVTSCPLHGGRHAIVQRAAGLIYLACGCHQLAEGDEP